MRMSSVLVMTALALVPVGAGAHAEGLKAADRQWTETRRQPPAPKPPVSRLRLPPSLRHCGGEEVKTPSGWASSIGARPRTWTATLHARAVSGPQ